MVSSTPIDGSEFEFNTSSTFELTQNEIKQSKDLEGKMYERKSERKGKYMTSSIGAFLHVVKSSLGTGFLAMPYAFHNAGLLAGFLGTAFVAFLCAHCTHILVKSSQELCYLEQKPSMSYTETVVSSFRIGAGKRLVKYTGIIRHCINFFMFFTYYGVNTVYVIFIASSFQQVLENHTDISINIRWYALALFIILLPVGILRHMKFLVPFSALANILLLIGCSLTLYYLVQDLPPLSSRPLIVEMVKWPLFFSTALFGMEGIGVVMPIENAMRKPKDFLSCPGVLSCGMTLVASMFLIIGSFGYLCYGDDVKGSISLNLPQDALSEVVKIFIALAILFSYGLQLTASMEVVWDYVKDKFSDNKKDMGYYIVRTILILGTVAIGILVPNLAPVLSLVGAFGFSGLGILFPAIVETVTFWDQGMGPFNIVLIKNIFLVLICIFAMIAGSITSVAEIVKEYSLS